MAWRINGGMAKAAVAYHGGVVSAAKAAANSGNQ